MTRQAILLRCFLSWCVLGSILLSGCSGGGGSGMSTSASAAVQIQAPVLAGSPTGSQAGSISIPYKLYASAFTQVSVRAEYSIDGGPFLTATGAVGSDGINELAATPYGSAHVFVWDSLSDIGKRTVTVQFRIVAEGSATPAVTAPFAVDNPGAPTVTSFTPTTGDSGQEIWITINGTNLRRLIGVALVDTQSGDVVPLTNMSSVSDSLLYAMVPANTAASTYILRVETLTGTATLGTRFQLYEGKPVIAVVSPGTGRATVQVLLSIAGSQFGSAFEAYLESVDTRVRTDLGEFTRRSATEITAVVPAGIASGFYYVFVSNKSKAVHNDAVIRYTATRVPTATGVSPTTGPNTAALAVTVTGQYLAGVTAGYAQPRSVGTVGTLTSIQVQSNTSLTCQIPAGLKPGKYDIILTNASGTGARGGAVFTVAEEGPVVTSISPSTILNTAVRRVSISGRNLSGAQWVKLQRQGGQETASISPTFVTSSTLVIADIPSYLVPGTWTVAVQNSVGSSSGGAELKITEAAPVIESLNPTSGLNDRAVPVQAQGANLLGASAVTVIGPKPATTVAATLSPVVNRQNHTAVTFTMPAGLKPGEYSLTITNTTGTSSALSFTVREPAPSITALIPSTVVNNAQTVVTLVGTSMWGVFQVILTGPQSLTLTPSPATSNSKIDMTVPAGLKPGPYTIQVTNSGGTTTSAILLRVEEPAPVVTQVSPASASNTSACVITVTGENFLGASAVRLAGPEDFTISTVGVVSSTQLNATVPAFKRPGTYTVNVSNTTAWSSHAGSFTITEGLPAITQLTPSFGLDTKATDVSVIGGNLLGASEVLLSKLNSTFNTTCTVLVVESSTRIRVQVPSGLPPGLYNWQVRNSTGLSNALSYSVTELRPALERLEPAYGSSIANTGVTGRGNNLLGVFELCLAPVRTNSTLATRQTTRTFTVTGPNHLTDFPATITEPIIPGLYRATVVNTAARSDATTAPTYQVVEAIPTLTSITPRVMPYDVSTNVDIRGTGLLGTLSVTFTAPTTVRVYAPDTVVDDTRINLTVQAPMLASTYVVQVCNTAGVSSNSLSLTVTDTGFKDRQFSGSLAILPDNSTLFVANVSKPTISRMRISGNSLTKLDEISVGKEPTAITVDPAGTRAYVTNRADGTVSVVDTVAVTQTAVIRVGSEPIGCVLTPSGRFLYVANSTSRTVSVIDTRTNLVTATVTLSSVDFPFAVACTNDGDQDDLDEKVYVTQYFGQLPDDTRPPIYYGDTDTGRVGKVTVLSVATNQVQKTIDLAPHLTGFTADRQLFGESANVSTSAWPNLLSSIIVRGRKAYVASGAASPEGPLVYDGNQHSLLSVIDTGNDTEVTTGTISLNKALKSEASPGIAFNIPWGMAYAPGQSFCYLAAAGSNVIVKVDLTSDGIPSVGGAGGVVRIPVGKNPRSVLFDVAGTRAFVHNTISRDVCLINPFSHTVVSTVQATDPPSTGNSLEVSIAHGEELFNTSTNRMSENGFGSCFGCHPFGWSDTVVWAFKNGPRKTPALNAVFARDDPTDQKLLNLSATYDEVADFELNIRDISANVSPTDTNPSRGLMVGVRGDTIFPLLPTANSTRSSDWVDIENYLKYRVRSPISPRRGTDVSGGRTVFIEAGCATCHGSPKWTVSGRTYLPPPPSSVTVTSSGEVEYVLKDVDTFLSGERDHKNAAALGADGFNPRSLLGTWAFAPFFHHGQALSLSELLDSPIHLISHKDVGVPNRVDTETKRDNLVAFLESIDDTTPAFRGFSESQFSGSLALCCEDSLLWVANGCGSTVTYMNADSSNGTLTKGGEITVGDEPWSVAVDPTGSKAYVTNRASGTVSVIDVASKTKIADISVGAEPCGCALTPTGRFLFVCNLMSDSVSVIDTAKQQVDTTISITSSSGGRTFPFSVAITNNGDMDDEDEKVYVTEYFGQLRAGTLPDRAIGDSDTGRVGRVAVLSVGGRSFLKHIDLAPHSTGFPLSGSIPMTSAWPNLLAAIFIRDHRAYVTSSATSPAAPVRYDLNKQAFVSVIDTVSDTEVPDSTSYRPNLNESVRDELPQGPFLNTPWGIALAPGGTSGYVVSAAGDVVVRATVDSNGIPTIQDVTGQITRVSVGKNPRSLVFNRTGTRAYVHNYIDRTVSVINPASDTVVQSPAASTLSQPTPGSLEALVLKGEELFNTSLGTSSLDLSTNRMSESGWGSCFSCHPFGWSDTTVWDFGPGPRRTLPLCGTFGRSDSTQRVLNWSATMDEIADMEMKIRTVTSTVSVTDTSPLHGLIINTAGNDIPAIVPKANTGRSADWTAIEDYIRYGVRSPISPLRGTDQSLGRAAFAAAGCTSCHGGSRWSSSLRSWTPPPLLAPTGTVSLTAQGEIFDVLEQVGTFEGTSGNPNAIGANGFNPPSLLGGWAFGPFLHNGQSVTLDALLRGGPSPHLVADSITRGRIIQFLISIDSATPSF